MTPISHNTRQNTCETTIATLLLSMRALKTNGVVLKPLYLFRNYFETYRYETDLLLCFIVE